MAASIVSSDLTNRIAPPFKSTGRKIAYQLYQNRRAISAIALGILALAGVTIGVGMSSHSFTAIPSFLWEIDAAGLLVAGVLLAIIVNNVATRRGFEIFFSDHSNDQSLTEGQSTAVVVRNYKGQQKVLKIYSSEYLAICPQAKFCGEYLAAKAGGLRGSAVPTHFLVESDGLVTIVGVDEVTDEDRIRGSLTPFKSNHKDLYKLKDGNLQLKSAISLAQSVEELHKKGLAHSDIKPANVLIDHSGNIILIDFDYLTNAQSHKFGDGTRLYSSPEKQRHTAPYDTKKADVYALGRLLGKKMLGLPLCDSLNRQIDWDSAYLSEERFSRQQELCQLILEMTDSDPTKRPAIGDVARRLRVIANRG